MEENWVGDFWQRHTKGRKNGQLLTVRIYNTEKNRTVVYLSDTLNLRGGGGANKEGKAPRVKGSKFEKPTSKEAMLIIRLRRNLTPSFYLAMYFRSLALYKDSTDSNKLQSVSVTIRLHKCP